jgi:hypothetical protein
MGLSPIKKWRSLLMYTDRLCLAMVLLLLLGNNSLIALGATSVEVSMKKINSRKTRSDMEAMLKLVLILFLVSIAMLCRFSD